jgi:hypothetical protein
MLHLFLQQFTVILPPVIIRLWEESVLLEESLVIHGKQQLIVT